MKVTNICRKLAASLAAAGMLAFSTAHAADLNTNLLVNPSFEAVDPGFPVGDYSAVLITEGWTGDFGGGVGAYNVSLGYTAGTLPAGAGNYFYTFPANPTRARQNINLSGGASGSLIAAGNAFFNASAHFANWANPGTPNAGDGDYGRVIVMFQDSGGGTLGTPFTLNSASGVSPSGLLPWTQFGMDGPIPVGTTTAVVELLGVSASGATTARYREGYIDLVDFRVTNQLPPVALTVTINRDTGNITLGTNGTGSTANITRYTIESPFGSLLPDNWLSIADNYDAGSPGPNQIDANSNWTEVTAAGAHGDLTEQDSNTSGASIAPGRTVNLGNAWIKTPNEDLVFKYTLNGVQVEGNINFVGNGGQPFETGDFNTDGAVTAADWLVLRGSRFTDLSGLSTAEAYRRGDLTGNLVVNHTDFSEFKRIFESSNGAGSFEAMLASVPEPTSLAVMIFIVIFGLATGRSRGE